MLRSLSPNNSVYKIFAVIISAVEIYVEVGEIKHSAATGLAYLEVCSICNVFAKINAIALYDGVEFSVREEAHLLVAAIGVPISIAIGIGRHCVTAGAEAGCKVIRIADLIPVAAAYVPPLNEQKRWLINNSEPPRVTIMVALGGIF